MCVYIYIYLFLLIISYFPSRFSFPIQNPQGNFPILFENNPRFSLLYPTYIFKTFASDLTCLFRLAIFVAREYRPKGYTMRTRNWMKCIVQNESRRTVLTPRWSGWMQMGTPFFFLFPLYNPLKTVNK